MRVQQNSKNAEKSLYPPALIKKRQYKFFSSNHKRKYYQFFKQQYNFLTNSTKLHPVSLELDFCIQWFRCYGMNPRLYHVIRAITAICQIFLRPYTILNLTRISCSLLQFWTLWKLLTPHLCPLRFQNSKSLTPKSGFSIRQL